MEYKYNGIDFFKIISDDMKHYDYQYHQGLNILEDEFNDNEHDSCGKGGFYVTTNHYIHNFYSWGHYLYPITLPFGNKDFRILCVGNKYRVNMLIINEKYSLNDLDTYLRFNIELDFSRLDKIISSKELYDKYVGCGRDNLSQYKLINNVSRTHNEYAIQILYLWKNNNYDIKYSSLAFDNALHHKNIPVLDWWINSELEIKYTGYALNMTIATADGQFKEWLQKNGFFMSNTQKILCVMTPLILIIAGVLGYHFRK
jgi:hypothetical protein